jgi:hypothetical protein
MVISFVIWDNRSVAEEGRFRKGVNRGAALDAVGARLVERLAAGDIAADFLLLQQAKTHFADIEHVLRAPAIGDHHGRQHAVGTAGQALQDRHGVGFVFRLADHLAVDFHGRVGGQDGVRNQVPFANAPHAGLGLGQRHANNVFLGTLVRQYRFVDIGILARNATEHQQLEAHADLRQQFAPARAAGGEVDAGFKGDHPGFTPCDTGVP